MTYRLDRLLELIVRTEEEGPMYMDMMLDLRSHVEDLLPLLKEWEAACTSLTAIHTMDEWGPGVDALADDQRVQDAERALLAALRGEP